MSSVSVQAETSASSAAAGGAKITGGSRVAARQRTTIVLRSVSRMRTSLDQLCLLEGIKHRPWLRFTGSCIPRSDGSAEDALPTDQDEAGD